MRRKLLEVLVDPLTGEPLSLVEADQPDPITKGTLTSPSGAHYPIVGGIPRLVTSQTYSQSFGLQWNRFARVQLDSSTGNDHSRRRFDSEISWASRDLEGKWVLDAGCGSGRFAEIAASYGAEVLAVDLSTAVDAAQANLGHLPNVHVVQADVRALPFRRGLIQHLYSIGVLQHTPDPLGTIESLVAFLPPGARFALTIYGRRPWTRLYSKYWVRPLTKRLPPHRLLASIERAMPLLFPVTSVLFSAPIVGWLFRFLIPVANYVDKTDVPRDLRYQEAILDTFDMLSPRFDSPVTAREVESALAEIATSVVFRSHIPVVVHGVRCNSNPITNLLSGGTPRG